MSVKVATPEHILQVGMGFFASKTLLSAVELGVFTLLAKGPKTGGEIEMALGLHSRATYDFLDTLLSLGFLEREGDGGRALYQNASDANLFLDKAKPSYVGGILEMANARLYGFWGDLTEALKTGKPQNEIKLTGSSMFAELYSDPARLEGFMNAMSGISLGNFTAFAQKFDFAPYQTLADIGGAAAVLSTIVASHHPHISATSYDLPIVKPIAEKRIAASNLKDRVKAGEIDFFKDEFPQADLITMGMILHDWDLENKKMLIGKAFRALPEGGALVAIENLIDDARRENAFGLMMSLNMLIEFGVAFDFTGAQYREWCLEAGFKRIEVLHLAGPCSAAIAYK